MTPAVTKLEGDKYYALLYQSSILATVSGLVGEAALSRARL